MSQVIANYLVNGLNPSTIGGTGTAVKYFPQPSGQIGVAGTTPAANNSTGCLTIPGNSRLNGQLFTVSAIGSVYTDPSIACPTVTIELKVVTGNVGGPGPSYTTIATTGAVGTSSLAYQDEPFRINASLSVDKDSGVLQGVYTALYNDVLKSSTPAITTAVLGLDPSLDKPFGFVIGVTFNTSGAANLAKLYQFNIEG